MSVAGRSTPPSRVAPRPSDLKVKPESTYRKSRILHSHPSIALMSKTMSRMIGRSTRRTFLSTCAACAGLYLMVCDGLAETPDRSETVLSHQRPMFIESAGLRVRDLEGMILFYRQIIGLELMSRTNSTASLGIGGVILIELTSAPKSQSAPTGAAGLYHVAFEMPTRLDLARWVAFVAKHRFQVSGLADHLVTESVYISDPDGNGVEVYASRPESDWKWTDGHVAMGVYDFDVPSLLKLVDLKTVNYPSAPAGMRIGHIHLKVGDVDRAESFYSKLIGFDVTRRAPGVVFMSSGRYHHHVAANTWESEGAGPRSYDSPGLSWFSIAMRDHSSIGEFEKQLKVSAIPYRREGDDLVVDDPWNNSVKLIF